MQCTNTEYILFVYVRGNEAKYNAIEKDGTHLTKNPDENLIYIPWDTDTQCNGTVKVVDGKAKTVREPRKKDRITKVCIALNL